MKAVILAGGFGSRLGHETRTKPKPMVEIGNRPIIWHIMKQYSHHGINDFVVCCGYKSKQIKDYFINYWAEHCDVEIKLKPNAIKVHNCNVEPWNITLADTGLKTMTGGRLKKIEKYLEGSDTFCMTYGDGVGDINITDSIRFHKQHNKLATITTASPPGRFGHVKLDGQKVTSFQEKPQKGGLHVNAGYFVLSKSTLALIEGPNTIWEEEPLTLLAEQGQLMGFQHSGFWQPMDTLSDKVLLNGLWDNNQAPWKLWN